MSHVYADYSKARIGHFFGLSGWQAAVIAVAAAPVLLAVNNAAWVPALALAGVWAVVVAVTVTPVRGRSAVNWLASTTSFAVGGLAGWTRFTSRAAAGTTTDLDQVDLPGVLSGVSVHDGPPLGASATRVAIIADHTTRTWAVTAAVVHPGIGMSPGEDRDRYGAGLAELLDLASRTELVDEILLVVRTVPEDGAERDQWITRHRRPGGPDLARVVNDELQTNLSGASVRTESFVTLVVPEARIARPAKESGGGLEGRARVLYGLLSEVEAQLRGALGMTSVSWLTSPQLAAACRTGFAPGDRAGIIDALAARESNPGRGRGRALGDGRPVGGGRRRPALLPRRVELDLRHDQAPRQGGTDGRLGPGADPDRAGGAALFRRRVPGDQPVRRRPSVRLE